MPTLFKIDQAHRLPKDAEIVERDGKPHVKLREAGRTVYYPLTANGKKYLKPSAKWHAWIPQADGNRDRVPLSPNKSAAAVMLAKLLKDIEEEKAGIRTPAAGQQRRPLSELLAEYRTYHADQGNTPEQTTLTVRRCELTLIGCKFIILADVNAAAVDRWLAEQQRTKTRFGTQTRNHYVAALKAFGNWLVEGSKAVANPFRTLAKQNVAVDVRHERRPLTPEEFDRLLAAARTGKKFRKLSGPDRAMLYTVAAHTGFRASELASLSPASFALDAAPPTLTVEAGYSKHRRKDTVPVHTELVAVLRPWLATRPIDVSLWPGKWAKHHSAIDIIRRDLEVARAR
jgi:integrase